MNKNLIYLGFCFLFVQSSFAQNYWKHILNNDRAAAYTSVEAEYKKNKSLENILSKEIIWYETGRVDPSTSFLKDFTAHAEFPNYLYALWNEEYLFGSYISDGFNKTKRETIETLYGKKYNDITLSSAMSYLNAILARQYNNFPGYRKFSKEIEMIRSWQFCGVFENLNNSGLDVVYEPELHATNVHPFEANSNGKVGWYTPTKGDYESYMHFNGHDEYGTGVHYAQTFIKNSSARRVQLRLGASDRIKVWLNDVVIFESAKSLRTDMDAFIVEMNLPQGNNRLLIKVSGESNSNYFSARLTDLNGKFLSDLQIASEPSEYLKSTLEEVNPLELKTNFEKYFIDKVASEPDNFFFNYCLIKTYMRNQKYEEAKEVLLPWYENYPKSSIVRRLMIDINSLEENYTSRDEIKENLQKDDENYYLSMAYKFGDTKELFRLSAIDMEKFLNKYAEMVDDEIITNTCKIILSLRKENKNETKKYLEKLIRLASDREELDLIKVYAPIYSSVFNDTKSHLRILEAVNKKYFDYDVRSSLSDYYDGINKNAKAFVYLTENEKNLDYDFLTTGDIVDYLQNHEKYKESIPYIERMLKLYPYSFISMKMMGNALLQTGKEKEAIEFYNRSLVHNSGDISLRRKVQDISDHKDLIEDYIEKDIYKYIAENKNKIEKNNYGFNILKDDAIIELYPESGGRGRYTTIFEITSDKGIERLKEYNLGLYGNYNIIKSEIVKKDGSINPADASGSRFVFKGLSVGDIILIDFQKGFSNTGRFYKDFVDNFTFTSFHPAVSKKYILIAPKEKVFNYKVANKEVDFNVKEVDENKVYTWSISNDMGCAQSESYMPKLVDFASILHISTIKDWNEIANWYSDLVRSQMIIDDEVKKEFKSIFPEGNFASLSEDERAKRIYYYLMNNFNYSSVSFRQSGFIPQKPGKTLRTKLGDCKDFSTVYATFAKMAGLEANLVLVLTADNGQQSLLLPSQDFNHCIVRVMINGKEQFLELTDKNLPYKALPNGVRQATILVIPYTSGNGTKYDLRKLDRPDRSENSVAKKVEMRVNSTDQKYTITSVLKGEGRSSWADIFDTPTYSSYKKEVTEFYQGRINSNAKIDTVYTLQTKKEADDLSFVTKVSVSEKLNKIGEFKIVKIPHVHFEYNGSIISEDERKHMIEYRQYEETDLYTLEYDIFLDEPGEFTEIPKDKNLSYKGHSYVRTYKKVGPKQLKITVTARPSVENINPEDYSAFKEYVKSILEAKDEFVGYK